MFNQLLRKLQKKLNDQMCDASAPCVITSTLMRADNTAFPVCVTASASHCLQCWIALIDLHAAPCNLCNLLTNEFQNVKFQKSVICKRNRTPRDWFVAQTTLCMQIVSDNRLLSLFPPS